MCFECMFECHVYAQLLPVVEDRDSLSHMCLQCLSQLASLTGPALARQSDKAVFVQAYIQELISFMTRCCLCTLLVSCPLHLLPPTRPGVRTGMMCSLMAACRRLLDNFSTTQVVSIDKDTLSQFLSLLSRVSVDASKQAALVGVSRCVFPPIVRPVLDYFPNYVCRTAKHPTKEKRHLRVFREYGFV